MIIRLHRQETITSKIRAVLQESEEPASTLVKRYEISKLTVAKGRERR